MLVIVIDTSARLNSPESFSAPALSLALRHTRMSETADVIIIGGGIMGASTAYHLAHRGVRRVVLVEREAMFGLGSTGQNAGGFRLQFASRVNIELSRLSIGKMDRFADEMDQPIGMKRCGYLFLLDTPADVAQFEANVALQNGCGVPSRMVSLEEIAALAPEVDLSGIIAGSWHAGDGLVDPHALLQGYVSNARRLGAELRTDSAVESIERRSDCYRVRLRDSLIEAPNVVIAAGAWSAEIGDMLGIRIPVAPVRRQIAVTAPIPSLRPDFSFIIDFSSALYFHREGHAILTGMSNRDQAEGFDISVDEEWRLLHLERAVERLPMLADAQIASEWGGLYEVTPDHQPMIGAVDGMRGLYVCAGFSGHGLMHGPAAGQLVAEEILDGGAHSIDISSLKWSRFERSEMAAEYNVV